MNIYRLTRHVLCAGALLGASTAIASPPTAIYGVTVDYLYENSGTPDVITAATMTVVGMFPANTRVATSGLFPDFNCTYKLLDKGKPSDFGELECELSLPFEMDDDGHVWPPYDFVCGSHETWRVGVEVVTNGTQNGRGDRFPDYAPQDNGFMDVTFSNPLCTPPATPNG